VKAQSSLFHAGRQDGARVQGCDQPSEKERNHRLLQLVILLRASANARPAATELHAWLV
jgi:hypothetical protein